MRSRHHERRTAPQDLLAHEGGQARHGLLAVEHHLHLGVASRERVADDHEVGVLGHVALGVGRAHGKAQGFELRGHRRVDVLVGSGEGVAPLRQEARERGHGGARDPREVDLQAGAGSNTSKRAEDDVQESRARAPRGRVTAGFTVWPLERPRATGTLKPSRASRITASRE